jgi:FixJ family two-component response regulator
MNEPNKSLISIVDDEECVRESLSSLIRSVGYKAEDYPSAENFLTEGKWDETACLILDVRLPGMGGLELQRRLTEMEPGHPPIVFISGHASAKDQTWATRSGAVAFLHKPFSDDSLLDAVRTSIDRGHPKRNQVCPLCHDVSRLGCLPHGLGREEADLRATVLDLIKTVIPGWKEEDGLCEQCWSFYFDLGSMLVYSRNAGRLHGTGSPIRS